MFVRMTTLQHWKSEHDAFSCEDAVRADLAQGLFVLADGAGTTLFSNIWARVLVEYFLQVPLLSNDPFEVEWWIRQAQNRYHQEVPPLPASSWSARQKARDQGSYATLAALRVLKQDAHSLQVEFLAVGDSCLLICKADERALQTFPYTRPEEFDSAPICLPSMLILFDRAFHHCLLQPHTFAPGDQVMLATDAVARWIISAGKGSCTDANEAFHNVAEQTPDSWPAFVEECRQYRGMVDDDSTALCLSFMGEAEQDTNETGMVSGHRPEVRSLRKQEFEHAQEEQNKELQAIVYGDGTDLALEGIFLSPDERAHARLVADALHTVLSELRRTLNSADMLASMKRIWARYAPLLDTEPCAANVRQTLLQSGVLPLSPGGAHSALPKPVSPVALTPDWSGTSLAPEGHAHLSDPPFAGPSGDQHTIQTSLVSKDIAQMALAYTRLPEDVSFLSPSEQEQLHLAYRFKTAFDDHSDDQLLEVYTQILASGYLPFFDLNGHENERIAIIAHREEAQMQGTEWVSSQRTLSTEWVEKVSLVKHFYLVYKERLVPLNQIEQLAIADLENEPLVRLGIQEINSLNKRRVLDPDRELKKDFKHFRSARRKDCDMLIHHYNLSEDDIKSVVAMFVRAQLLEDYLQRTIHLSLQDWLRQRKRPVPYNYLKER
ncbi:MAG TPA: protein phosphatase 2C domain-containing protein [Ktedonobacteraceae bacterium]